MEANLLIRSRHFAVLALFISSNFPAALAQEDDYEFPPPRGNHLSETGDDDASSLLAEGFEGLDAEPGKDPTIEPIDGAGGFDNVAPRLGSEEGPGGLDWDPSPTYRTRYKGVTDYPAGSGTRLQGNNWFMGFPYLTYHSGSQQYRLRFGANVFRVFTYVDSTTWVGKYGNLNAKLKKSGSDLYLYDTRGKKYTFLSSNSLKCSKIEGLASSAGASPEITITYGSNITVLQKPAGGSEVRRFTYTITSNRIDKIDIEEKISGSWYLYRKIDFTYHENISGAVEGSTGDLIGIKEETLLSQASTWLERKWVFKYFTGSYNPSTNKGYPYQVKAVLGPQSVHAWEVANSLLPTTDIFKKTADQLSSYVDRAYEYEEDERRLLTLELKSGCGCGTSEGVYAYAWDSYGSTPSDLNAWANQVTITLPTAIGATRTIDYNDYSQTLNSIVDEVSSPYRRWIRTWRHDTTGRLTDSYSVNACTSYTSHVVGTVSDAGQRWVYTYDTNSALSTVRLRDPANGHLNLQSRKSIDFVIENGGGHRRRFLKRIDRVYRNEIEVGNDNTNFMIADTSDYATTKYDYVFTGSDVFVVKKRTTTLPVIVTGENGLGTAVTRSDHFETDGLHTWSKDGDGFVHYRGYDSQRRTVTKTVRNINTASLPSGVPSPPSGEGFETTSGLNIVTDYEYDYLRRPRKEIGPAFNAWTGTSIVSTNTTRQWHYTRLAGGEYVTVGYPHLGASYIPVAVTLSVEDFEGHVLTSALGQVTTGDTGFDNDITESGITLQSAFNGTILQRTDNVYVGDKLQSEQVWTGPDNLITYHTYDAAGRNRTVTNPAGTITRTSYDALGRVKKTEVGTDAGSPGNMTTIEERFYDGEEDAATSFGEGNLTRVTRHVSYLGGDERITNNIYDYRQRVTDVEEPEDVQELTTYDNRGMVLTVERYTSSGALRMAKTQNLYDAWGQAYETREYGVLANGTLDGYANTRYWRNGRGLGIKTQSRGKVLEKTQYDGAGRVTNSAVSYDLGGGEGNYSAAADLADDTVMEETRNFYDKTGAVELSAFYQRRHDGTGPAGLTEGSSGNGRAQYAANWYDQFHRQTHLANYGTNGGTNMTSRPTGNPPSTSSSTSLVRKFTYTILSQVDDDIDPNAIKTRLFYDNAGRTVKRIERYVDGTPGPASDADRTTEYIYDAQGRLAEVIATQAGYGGSPPGYYDLRTGFEYGVVRGEDEGDSTITSNDLVVRIKYPDPDEDFLGEPSEDSEDQEAFAHNAQGETIWRQDQRGIAHEFEYDLRGRLVHDRVATATPLPGGVDAWVLRISSTYDALDRPMLLTSYNDPDATASSNKKNEAKYDYGKYSTVTSHWQEWTSGTSVTGSSPRVQYSYSFPTAGEGAVRLVSTTYPSGRVVTENYTGTMDDTLSRVTGRTENGASVYSDQFLGLGRLVYRGYGNTYKAWTLLGTDSANQDNYFGFDRFGRIDNLIVKDVLSGTIINSYAYQYSSTSQITLREDLVGKIYPSTSLEFSESFEYDGLGRLAKHLRGIWGGASMTTVRRRECWTLDRQGNPTAFYNGTGGDCLTPTVTQAFNASNEITTRNGDSTWASYSASGDMTKKSASQANNTYDAWGRARNVGTSGSVLMVCESGACGQVIKQTSSPGLADRSYFYSGNQVLEEKALSGGATLNWYVWGSQGTDDLVSGSDTTTPKRHVLDANNNVVTKLDGTGGIVWRQIYDAYGNPRRVSGDWSTNPSISSDDYLYTGRQWHFNAGRYDYRSRWYDSGIERFMSTDSIGNWGDSRNSGNTYLYVANDPANRTDPWGEKGGMAEDASSWNRMTAEYMASLGIDVYRVDISTGKKTLVCKGRSNVEGNTPVSASTSSGSSGGEVQGCNDTQREQIAARGRQEGMDAAFELGCGIENARERKGKPCRNALRHCVRACVLKRECGEKRAREWLAKHEANEDNLADLEVDLCNNEVGLDYADFKDRRPGRKPAPCKLLCTWAIFNEELCLEPWAQ